MRIHTRSICAAFICTFLLASMLNVPAALPGSSYYSVSYTIIGTISQQIAYVDRANGGLDAISPLFFEINPDGSLKLAYGFSTTLITQMHNRSIRVVPYITNNWDQDLGKTAMNNRNALTTQIADTMIQYNIDGIDVDIENLDEDDRAAMTDFVRLLRAKLPADRTIAVAVAANPTGSTIGWHGSYDYTALATYADYLMMMTYEEHGQGGHEGANAGLSFTENSIKYALTKMPANKLVLGVPFYGHYWKQGSAYSGYALTNAEAEYLIANYPSNVTWDAQSQTPMAQVTIGAGDAKPTVLYRTLTEGTYNVWYENETSMRSKLSLIRKYGLKGAGSWALGYEPAGMWSYYKDELQKSDPVAPTTRNVFSDIAGNWSYDNIMYVYDQGWMNGVGDGKFAPGMAITRAQAAALFVRALKLDDGATDLPNDFTDVSGNWASRYILLAVKNGIMLGVGENEFRPNEILTREQAAVLIERIIPPDPNYVRPTIAYFDQSIISKWAEEPLMRITTYRIMTGLPDYSFLPQNPLLRSEMAALIRRTMDYVKAHQ